MSTLSHTDVSVRDIPVSGLVVQLVVTDPQTAAYTALRLEPSEAAELAARLVLAADEAVHESRARRRVTPRSEPVDLGPLGPDPTTTGFDPFRL